MEPGPIYNRTNNPKKPTSQGKPPQKKQTNTKTEREKNPKKGKVKL